MNFLFSIYVFNFSLYSLGGKAVSELSCSENVTYDIVGNIVRMPTEANVSCMENSAYAIVKSHERI